MEHNQENKLHCRVVLFPQSYTGHLVPMLNLGYALYSKGFSITIIHTRFNAPDPTKYSNFDFYFIEDVLSKDKTSSTGSLDTIRVLNETCLEPFKDCLSHIMEVSSKDGEPVACLVSDPMWVFAGVVADQLNLPRLVLRTGGLLAFVLYDSLPVLKDKGYFPIQETQKEEALLEVPHLKVKDLPVEEHHNVLLNMVKETKNNCQGMICNTFKELEGSILDTVQAKMLATPIFLIGPLHKYSSTSSSSLVTQGQSSITWLNEQSPHSVLYVSFGTVAGISKEELLEVAFGIANSQQPFLWVIGPRLLNGSEKYEEFFPQYLLEILSKNGCIVEWAPQKEVLAHPAIGGFWTHCGWNSSIESICEGVPMICLPFFGDQMMNARYITDVLKIGLQLENGVLERNEIEKSIGRLMVGKEGRDIRERISDLKAKAKRCLMEGESSYESLDRLTSYILSFCGLKL